MLSLKEAILEESERHETKLSRIASAETLIQAIKPVLPDKWEIGHPNFPDVAIQNNREEEISAQQFKLVCKLVESAYGKKQAIKVSRSATVDKDNTISYLVGQAHGKVDKHYISTTIYHFNPAHTEDCEITWKRKWSKVATVSDKCLGLSD